MTNIQNFTVNTDWIQLYFIGKFDYEVGNTRQIGKNLYIKTLKTHSRQFAHVSEVFYNSQKVGVIQHQPYDNSVLADNSIIFHLDNQLNYEENFIGKIDAIRKAGNWEYKNITRLDVCTDGKGFLAPMQKVREGKIDLVGRCDITDTTMVEDGKRVLKQSTIGSRKSDMYVKIYRKDKEIEHSGKGYIKQFWAKNGVKEEDFKGMERFEMTFKSERITKFVDTETGEFAFSKGKFEDLYKLQDSNFLNLLIQSNVKNHFEFVKVNRITKNITRAKRVFCMQLVGKLTKLLTRVQVVGKKSQRWAQTLIKNNYMVYLKSRNGLYLATMQEIIKNFDLSVWFEKRIEQWNYEYNLCYKNESERVWIKLAKIGLPNSQTTIAENQILPVKTW